MEIKRYPSRAPLTDAENQAIKHMEAAGLDPEPGKVYHVWADGCITTDSAITTIRVNGHSRRIPVCPNHKGEKVRILTRYKLCDCGTSWFSLQIKETKKCSACNGSSTRTVGLRGESGVAYIYHKTESKPPVKRTVAKSSTKAERQKCELYPRRCGGNRCRLAGFEGCSQFRPPEKHTLLDIGWEQFRGMLAAYNAA